MMAGLLGDFEDPRQQGLLALGLGLLNSRGSFGQGLGQAGMQAMDVMRQAAMDKQRKAQQEQAQQLQAVQMRAAQQQMAAQQQQMAEHQRAAAEREKLSALAASSARSPQQMAMSANGGPTMSAAQQAPTTAPGFDWQGYAGGLAAINPMMALQVQQSLKKEQPKLSKLEPMRDAQGRMVNVAVFEDGTSKVLPYGVKPEIALQNLGNRVVAIDKNSTASGASFGIGTSPDTVYQGGVTMRGQNLTDSRQRDANNINKEAARVQIINDPNQGLLLVDKGTGLARAAVGFDGKPVPGEKAAADKKGAKAALELIGQAEGIIPGATGSIAGDLYDKTLAAISISTPGAQGTAQLKALEGALMLRQPRMEGPQSNADALLYRQMAAQIGDPWVPRATKLKALSTVKEIQSRYAGVVDGVPSDISDIMNQYKKR